MTREFETGATRDTDEDKLDYEGFLSPSVLKRFAEYMHKCRLRNIPKGQKIRGSDNWQKGMPKEAYMKSLLRHIMEVWQGHRDGQVSEEALCAVLFNTQGYLHELLKERNDVKRPERDNSTSRPLSPVQQSESVYAEEPIVRNVLQKETHSRRTCDCKFCTCGEGRGIGKAFDPEL